MSDNEFDLGSSSARSRDDETLSNVSGLIDESEAGIGTIDAAVAGVLSRAPGASVSILNVPVAAGHGESREQRGAMIRTAGCRASPRRVLSRKSSGDG